MKANNTTKNASTKNASKKVTTTIVKPTKKAVVVPKVTFKEQIEGNSKFKNAMQVECKKLGYALGLLESHLTCFAPLVQDYIKQIRNEQILYKLAELNCPKSKSGNYTPWLLQSYIRNTINKAK
jgi:hypothetical protein